MYQRFLYQTQGKAHSANIIQDGQWRFTVLTSRLIRMEYSEEGIFEDRATQVVFCRDFPECEYNITEQEGNLIIDTEHLTLCYRKDYKFAENTLQICLKDMSVVWKYGQKIPTTLKGTARTLDGADGETVLEEGMCSRSGYTILDDSEQMVLTEDGWFDLRPCESIDVYFFGYGHDYKACIQDFYRLTGAPPLLPAYALGNWWSRYHAYTQQEYCDLIARFEKENLPFSVAVVDMDWHIVKIPEVCRVTGKEYDNGWTGYTWNEDLFPNYRQFLNYLKEHGLKTSLNLHPAQGIGCHEKQYRQMAEASDIDPNSKKRIKLDLLNPEFMKHYFDILHHPYEEDGVDFWWMDWQQGTSYWWIHDEDHPSNRLEKMDPLWLLNHLHVADISRNGKRPMFFSRYSGLGAHRYPVGFSGDTIITWKSLQFQPYFTATASNVGYSWWSHDIGGHMCGYRDDELVVRWMQLGVLSPINRLHSSDNPFSGKEPWNLNCEAEKIAGDWLRLRHALFPYLYAMNYRNNQELLPMIQPMYYSHPEEEEAYEVKNQYWFGSELIVCPITEKCDSVSLQGMAEVWFPEGMWIDFFGGFIYRGKCKRKVHRSLAQMPVFAKAGAIVPMETNKKDNALGRQEEITVFIFPGADNSFVLIEDEGDGVPDENHVKTQFDLEWGQQVTFTISSEGNFKLLPERRKWKLAFRGFAEDIKVTAQKNGKPVEVITEYDKKTATMTACIEAAACDRIEVNLVKESGYLTENQHAEERIFELLLHAQMGYKEKLDLYQDGMKRFRNRLFYASGVKEYQPLLDALNELLILQVEK